MKRILLLTTAACLAFVFCPACTTARHAAEDSTDLAAHAVKKTGHAMEHGARKVENNL